MGVLFYITSRRDVIIGGVLFLGAVPLLFWNEYWAVPETLFNAEIKANMVSLGLSIFNSPTSATTREKPVYVTGFLTGNHFSSSVLFDEDFDLRATDVLKYRRLVEMYQWEEKATRTRRVPWSLDKKAISEDYGYSKRWSKDVINSDAFYESSGHENPKDAFFVKTIYQSQKTQYITIGAYGIRDGFMTKIKWWEDLKEPPLNLNKPYIPTFPEGYSASVVGGQVFFKKFQNGTFSIGDIRVTFSVVNPTNASVIAMQTEDDKLVPYTTKSGKELFIVEQGMKTMTEMFDDAGILILTWICRFGGFLAIYVGLCLVLSTVNFVDIIHGDYILVAVIISLPLSLLVISIVWVLFRPSLVILQLVLLSVLYASYAGIYVVLSTVTFVDIFDGDCTLVAFLISFPLSLLVISIAWVLFRPYLVILPLVLLAVLYYIFSEVVTKQKKVPLDVDDIEMISTLCEQEN